MSVEVASTRVQLPVEPCHHSRGTLVSTHFQGSGASQPSAGPFAGMINSRSGWKMRGLSFGPSSARVS